MNDQPDELDPYEIFAIAESDGVFEQCPVDYKILHQQQQQDRALQLLVQQKVYSLMPFHRYK